MTRIDLSRSGGAMGHARKSLLGTEDKIDDLPDFYAVLNGKSGADFIRNQLKAFFHVVEHTPHHWKSLLIELAIIDDESWERWQALKPEERSHRFDLQPSFVSLIASYGEFGRDDRLLQAWHAAIERVVNAEGQSGRSMVGEDTMYESAFLDCPWQREQSLARDNTQDPSIRPAVTLLDGPDAVAAYRADYKFGLRTAAKYDSTTAETSDRDVLTIAEELMRAFASEAYRKFSGPSDARAVDALERSVLLAIPFRRPSIALRTGRAIDFRDNPIERAKRDDHAGGCLFLLIELDADPNRAEIEKLVLRLSHLLVRCSMLDVKSSREYKRLIELNQFMHSLATAHTQLEDSVRLIGDDIRRLQLSDERILNRQEAACANVVRLRKLGEVARDAFLKRHLHEKPSVFQVKESLGRFCVRCEEIMTNSLESTARWESARSIGQPKPVPSLMFSCQVEPPDAVVFYDNGYLTLLLAEVAKNAYRHGYFKDAPFSVILKTEEGHVELSASNRIAPHQTENLRRVLKESKFRLGLGHMVNLAFAWGVKEPYSEAPDGEYVLHCIVARLAERKDQRA